MHPRLEIMLARKPPKRDPDWASSWPVLFAVVVCAGLLLNLPGVK
jgi:hypothetical protein